MCIYRLPEGGLRLRPDVEGLVSRPAGAPDLVYIYIYTCVYIYIYIYNSSLVAMA